MDVGTVIAARYEIKRDIGRGGMGQVWLAHDRHLKRSVAVKTMAPEATTDPEHAVQDGKRFEREATAVARLDHAGLATVYDLGEEAGTRYLAMQYVQGLDLADFIAERGRLSLEETSAIGVQICSVLAAAHALRIVHRDLKPGNIRIRTDGIVKVLDFGIAAVLDPKQTKLTATGEMLGSWHYMAPEQIEGGPVDERTDLYALGCLLHEMLSSTPPFTHDSPLMLPDLHRTATPTPLRQLDPALPTELEDLVLSLLAKESEARPSHAGEVYQRLAAWLPQPEPPTHALIPWTAADPCRPFRHPMAPGARPVRMWASHRLTR